MKKYLIVVDMQTDFVNGALGTKEAEGILAGVVRKINDFEGEIFVTFDTHFENYMQSLEGEKLPVPHCIKGSAGHALNPAVEAALSQKPHRNVEKYTFGTFDIADAIRQADDTAFEIELIGLCTDICVISNALILRAAFPNTKISVDAACCAGVTPQKHLAALEVMRSCQIDVYNDERG